MNERRSTDLVSARKVRRESRHGQSVPAKNPRGLVGDDGRPLAFPRRPEVAVVLGKPGTAGRTALVAGRNEQIVDQG